MLLPHSREEGCEILLVLASSCSRNRSPAPFVRQVGLQRGANSRGSPPVIQYTTPKAFFFCSFGSRHCVSSRVQIPSWNFRGSRAGLQRHGGSKGQCSSSLHDGLLLLPTPSHETLHSDKSALCNAKVFVQKRCFSPENSTFNGRLQEGGGAAR